MACGMFLGQPASPVLAGGFLTAGPPGKSKLNIFFFLALLYDLQNLSSSTRDSSHIVDNYSSRDVCSVYWSGT